MTNDASVEIEETDNGYLITTNYSCYGGKQRMCFTEWSKAHAFICEVLRIKNNQPGDE